MKEIVKKFIKRGIAFGGFGPIIASIVILIISINDKDLIISPTQFATITLSTYLLGFIHAGTSVFHQGDISILKAMGLQLLFLYIAYLGSYLINNWIPFDWNVIIIFTLIFVIGYLIIWITIYLIIRYRIKKLNQKLNK